MYFRNASRIRALGLVSAIMLLSVSCAGGGMKGASVRSFVQQGGLGIAGITLNLSRDGGAILGSWEDPSMARAGIVEGEVKQGKAFTLRFFSAETRDAVGLLAGAYSRNESVITGSIQFGSDPARTIVLAAQDGPVANLSIRRASATSRKGLAKTAADPTQFYYLGFEPTRPAAFRDWYRGSFQGGKTLAKILEQERKAFIEDFEATTAARAAQVGNVELLPAWYYDGRQFLAYRGNGLFVMGLRRTVYTGEEKVSAALRYAVIDENALAILGPDAFLAPGWQAALPALLGASLREELGIEPGQSLVELGFVSETADPGNDFFVYSKGIGFHYSPGELAPESLGEFFIYLPFDRLGGLLQESVLEKYGLGPAAK